LRPNSKLPLKGKRIVITRAREQASTLAESLERLGAEILYFPSVAFSAPHDTSALDAAIAGLDRFDWLLLTSQNAVRYFCQRCRDLGTDAARENLQIAAVGPATAEAAQREGLRVTYVARQHSGAALADELGAVVRGKKLLLPRSDRAGEGLPAKLRAAGAEVTDVVAYCTVAPEPADAKISEAILAGRADAIVFASPSAVHHFVEQLGWPAMATLEKGTMLAAIGPTTAKAIREAGLRVGIEAAESTAQGLVIAIEEFFRKEFSSEVQGQ